jgi:hypothetical protein
MPRRKRPASPETTTSSTSIDADAVAAARAFWSDEEMKKARPISLDRDRREKGKDDGNPE